MTKKIFTVITLTAVAITLTGCFWKKEIITSESALPVLVTGGNTTEDVAEVQAPNDQPYTYIHKGKWFSFTLPAQRTFQENAFGSLVMFFAPQAEGDKIKENLGITTTELTGDINLTGFFELSKGIAEGRTNNFKIEKEEAITINGDNAMKIIYKGTDGENKLEWQQVVLLKWTTAYEFTYTATEDTFDNLIDEVDTIINTFTIN